MAAAIVRIKRLALAAVVMLIGTMGHANALSITDFRANEITDTDAFFSWNTDPFAATQYFVEGGGTSYLSASDNVLRRNHSAQVRGLQSGTQYTVFAVAVFLREPDFQEVEGVVYSRRAVFTMPRQGELNPNDIVYLDPAPVPEPSAYALVACGIGLLGLLARRRRR